MRKSAVFIFLSLLCCLTIISCGFQMRGTQPIPKELEMLYLQSSQPYGAFEQILRQSLHDYGIRVTNYPKTPLTLNVLSTTPQQIAGISSSTLQTQQYTMNYTVTFNVISSTGKVIVPTQSVTSSITFTADTTQMLNSNGFTQQFLGELQNNAAYRLLNVLLSQNSIKEIRQYNAAHAINTRTT